MRIAVAGGTGTVGRHIVAEARGRGHDAVVIARATGVDVLTGAGLDAALAGADTLIDTVSVGTMKAAESTAFFRLAARRLLEGAGRAGVSHAVLLSIVGIDRNPHGYYAGKVAQEGVYPQHDTPWSIVRATQFHEFAPQVAAQAAFGPLQLAPSARTMPIAAATVASRLLDVAEGGAAGRTVDVAGPQEEQLSDMIRAWARRTGKRGLVVPVSLPGAQMRGMRAGLALPGPEALRLGPTYAEWLADQTE